MNYVYVQFFFGEDLRKNSDILQLVKALPPETEILYVGESSNITPDKRDTNQSSISEFIAGYYPQRNVYDISKPAAHAEVYRVLLEQLPETSAVRTLVLTVNLRSFGADWRYSKLETALQKSMVLLRNNPPLYNRFLLAFKGYDIKDEMQRQQQFLDAWENEKLVFDYEVPYKNVNDWDRQLFKEGVKNADGTRNDSLTELACHFVKNFAFSIDTLTHPRIRDLDDIVELARRRGWNLVFNLLSENTERAGTLVGKDLLYLMDENRKLLVSYYERKGVHVVDNMYTVQDADFSDRAWPTEHYTERGRRAVAYKVAQALRTYYPADYVPYEKGSGRTRFFNNCEGVIRWQNMESISSEYAYSGTYASVAKPGNPNSITFSANTFNLPAYAHNFCDVELYWYAPTLPVQARLVMEMYIGANAPLRLEVPMQAGIAASWNRYRHTFGLPASFGQAWKLDVFVHNAGDNPLFTDDISVSFR